MVKRGKVAAKRAKVSVKASSGMPLGVKIISIFTYVLSAILFVISLFLFGAGAALDSADAQALIQEFIQDSTASATVASDVQLGVMIGAGVLLVSSILLFVVGRKLSQGKNWARILLIIFFGLGFIGALADILGGSILNNLPDLIIDGAVAGYLLFNNNVKSAFTK